MTELFLENGHLSDEGIRALIAGTLDETQRLEAAEHLSFCDDCLVRYTDLLSEDVLEQPQQDVTLPVMRRLRQRALKVVTKRHAAAVAAVVVTAGLWYTGVFGGAMDALSVKPQDITRRPPQEQQLEEKGPLAEMMQTMNQWMFPEPKSPDKHLGPENRPQTMDELNEPEALEQDEQNNKSLFDRLFDQNKD